MTHGNFPALVPWTPRPPKLPALLGASSPRYPRSFRAEFSNKNWECRRQVVGFPAFFPQCVAIVWTTSHIFSKQSGVLRGRLWDNLIWVCPFFWWCLSTTPMMCVTQSTAISTKKWLHDGDLSWGYHLFPMVPVVWSYPSHSASLLTSECCRWSFQLEKLHFEGTTT